MRISLWLPTFTHGEPDFTRLPERARLAERLGFDGVYLLDHLLPITGVHASAWLDTTVGLAMLASSTERVTIGTASMVVGFRHPVLLAKQLASLAVLAGPRVVLGAGSGWYAAEFESMGHRIEERAGRTDECLEALRLLLTGDNVTYEGGFWSFRNVTIEPRPRFPIPVLVAGGSRTPGAGSDHDRPVMVESVLKRILRWEGWLAPCAGSDDLTLHDLEAVRRGLHEQVGERQRPFRLAQVQWTHLVDTDDREAALRVQLPLFRSLMGGEHGDRHFTQSYLLGSIDDVRRRVGRLREAGFEELIVGPVTHEPAQMELIADVFRAAAADGGADAGSPGGMTPA
jgi:alkanesulfonate monooxygenase SsuD/methylene tetrahydromethanopterin reductase-like flavin-dependent oxidoreductase (luciferase family)